MTKSFADLTGALRVSVLEAIAAGGESINEILAKNFDRFEEELDAGLVAVLPPLAEEVDPLTHLALALEGLERSADEIAGGACLKIADMEPSDDGLVLLKATIDLGNLALRTMASEFAAPVAEGEQLGEHETLLKVATSGGDALVKTVLPKAAAELLADPADLGVELAEFGAELMLLAGVDAGKLAKAFPPKKKGPAEGAEKDPNAVEEEGEEGEEEEGEEEEAAAGEGAALVEDEGAGEPGDEPVEDVDGTPLENIAKLATGILLEIDELNQELGALDSADADGNPVANAIQGMAKQAALIAVQADALQAAVDGEGEMADEAAEKAAQAGALAKSAAQSLPIVLSAESELAKRAGDAEADVLEKNAEIEKLKAQIAALEAQPGLAKGAAKTVAVTKGQDNGSGSDEGETLDEQAERLAKLSPEARAHELMKLALSRPLGAPR